MAHWKHRNVLIPRHFSASLFIMINENPTDKDKPLPMDLFFLAVLVVFDVSFPFARFLLAPGLGPNPAL